MLDHMVEQHTTSLLYSLVMNAQMPNFWGKGKLVELLAYDEQIVSVKAVAAKNARLDKARASFYNSFSERKWGKPITISA